MSRQDTIIISAEIWIKGGKGSGFCLLLGWKDSCAIELCEARYKKDLLPKMREYKKMLKNIPDEQQLQVLHSIHNLAIKPEMNSD